MAGQLELTRLLIGALAGYLSLWSVYWLFKLATGKEGMGYGDFKLLAALGAWMGWKMLLPIILISSVVGAVVGPMLAGQPFAGAVSTAVVGNLATDGPLVDLNRLLAGNAAGWVLQEAVAINTAGQIVVRDRHQLPPDAVATRARQHRHRDAPADAVPAADDAGRRGQGGFPAARDVRHQPGGDHHALGRRP